MRLEPVAFRVDGDLVHGDLYRPEGESRPPVVIMGHGFGAERRFRLPAFAERLCMAGLAVLLFDYRGFGDSEGTPRGLVDPGRHLADFAAAVRYVQWLKGVDGARAVLWGTSFSGGHALVTAARLPGIAAVVAQVPHVDGLASAFRYPLRLLPGASLAGAARPGRRRTGARTGARTHHRSGGGALSGRAGSLRRLPRLIPPGTVWQETVPARILLTILAYRPVRVVRRIQAPVLIIAAEQDSLIPLTATRKTAARIARCQLEILPVGHFDLYEGPWFERSIALQIAFLRQHLGLAG